MTLYVYYNISAYTVPYCFIGRPVVVHRWFACNVVGPLCMCVCDVTRVNYLFYVFTVTSLNRAIETSLRASIVEISIVDQALNLLSHKCIRSYYVCLTS